MKMLNSAAFYPYQEIFWQYSWYPCDIRVTF